MEKLNSLLEQDRNLAGSKSSYSYLSLAGAASPKLLVGILLCALVGCSDSNDPVDLVDLVDLDLELESAIDLELESAEDIVSVSCDATDKPVSYSGIGFHSGVTDLNPADKFVEPLALTVVRRRDVQDYPRISELGADQVSIQTGGDSFRHLSLPESEIPEGVNRYASTWRRWDDGFKEAVTERVRGFTDAGYENVIFDVWNEPNLGMFFDGTKEEFFEHWARTVRHIREIAPGYQITGPSYATTGIPTFVPWSEVQLLVQEFLLFAHANDVMPDIVNWHDFSTEGLEDRVEDIRQYMWDNAIPERPIDMYEYLFLGPDEHFPATAIHYFAAFARADVTRAGRAYWHDFSEGETLNDTLTDDGLSARSSWWAYRRYSDLSGSQLQVTPGQSTDGVASFDEATGVTNILVGSQTGGETAILIENIGDCYQTSARNYESVIEVIPNTGEAELESPVLLDKQITQSQSRASVLVTLEEGDAIHVRIRPQ